MNARRAAFDALVMAREGRSSWDTGHDVMMRARNYMGRACVQATLRGAGEQARAFAEAWQLLDTRWDRLSADYIGTVGKRRAG